MGSIILLAILAWIGYKLYMKKNGRRIELEKAVKKNDKEAMVELAYSYAYGREGCAQNVDKAVSLMMQSESGRDMVDLAGALLGYTGNGAPKRPEQAFMLLDSATQYGDLKARYLLGDCYWDGEGTEKNYRKAIELYTAAVRDARLQNQDIHGMLAKKLADFYTKGYPEDGPGYTKGQGRNLNLAEHWAEEALKDYIDIGEDDAAARSCSTMIDYYMTAAEKPLDEKALDRWCYWACMRDIVAHTASQPGKFSSVEAFFQLNPDYPSERSEEKQGEAINLIERVTGQAVGIV